MLVSFYEINENIAYVILNIYSDTLNPFYILLKSKGQFSSRNAYIFS